MSSTATTDPGELAALVSAQRAMIRHAMKFPSVQVIVYSTCSIHAVENEEAIDDVIATSPGWKTEIALPWWHRRGVPSARCANDVVRTTLEDRTIGFFVSRLVRTEGQDTDKRKLNLKRSRVTKETGEEVQTKVAAATTAQPCENILYNPDDEELLQETSQNQPFAQQKSKSKRKRKRVVVEEQA
jgi:hypothetical protein